MNSNLQQPNVLQPQTSSQAPLNQQGVFGIQMSQAEYDRQIGEYLQLPSFSRR
jgi:hypothetical protein